VGAFGAVLLFLARISLPTEEFFPRRTFLFVSLSSIYESQAFRPLICRDHVFPFLFQGTAFSPFDVGPDRLPRSPLMNGTALHFQIAAQPVAPVSFWFPHVSRPLCLPFSTFFALIIHSDVRARLCLALWSPTHNINDIFLAFPPQSPSSPFFSFLPLGRNPSRVFCFPAKEGGTALPPPPPSPVPPCLLY